MSQPESQHHNIVGAVRVHGVSALVAAYEALDAPVTARGRVRCSSCSAQYQRTQYGLELCTRSVGGVVQEVVCGVCSGRVR